MKKICLLILAIILLVACCGCGEREPEPIDIDAIKGSDMCIDSASFDMDGDGIAEDCVMTYGPTSGLFTVVITISENGIVEYKNTFNLAFGELTFGEQNGEPHIFRTNTDISTGESRTESHRVYVENDRIVIDGLDAAFEGYWGDAEWNYDLR